MDGWSVNWMKLTLVFLLFYVSLPPSTSCKSSGNSTKKVESSLSPDDKEDVVYFIAGGGEHHGNIFKDIEFYHPIMNNLECKIRPPQLTENWKHHVTFYHQKTLYLCGGFYTPSICISYNINMNGWKTHSLPKSILFGHSSFVQKNMLYIIGGKDSRQNILDIGAVSTSLPLDDQPVLTPVPNLPYKGYGQCTIRLDEDTMVITGGYGRSNASSRGELATVAMFNVKTSTYTQLPQLKQPRHNHGCGLVKRGNTNWIIVAGGYSYTHGGYLQTAELLQLGGMEWEQIGNLNVQRVGSPSIIVTQRRVMILGGRGKGNGLSSVELLDWSTKQWSYMEPSLKKPKEQFGGAVEIPASMFDCSG